MICIYHVKEALLIKKFELTQNRSFDAMDDVISRKMMSEFGKICLEKIYYDVISTKEFPANLTEFV